MTNNTKKGFLSLLGKLILFTPLLFSTCIEPISIGVERTNPELVIDGRISNVDPPYRVRLSSVTNFDGTSTDNTFYLNAKVVIREIGGQSIELTEIGNGFYESNSDFKGQIGNSYQLMVELSNGDLYHSDIQTIPDTISPIEGRSELVVKTFFTDRLIEKSTLAYDVDVLVENSQSDHFYMIESSAWEKVDILNGDCPIPPSGRPICWSFKDKIVFNQIILGSNIGLDKSNNYYVSAVTAPANSKREYIAIVKFIAMSSENFAFWESVKDQLDKEGSIFDSPFAPVIGNITNNQTGQRTLGYFHAYSSSEINVCIDRSNKPGGNSIPPTTCLSCIEFWDPATYTDMYDLLCR